MKVSFHILDISIYMNEEIFEKYDEEIKKREKIFFENFRLSYRKVCEM
jgi:hypothetical protein